MPALNYDYSLISSRSEKLYQLSRRSNWAGENAGVTLVFCIVFVIVAVLIGLYVHKVLVAKRAAKA